MKYISLKEFCTKTASFPWPVVHCFAVHTIIVFAAAKMAGETLALAPGGFVNSLLPQTFDVVDKFTKWDAHWYTYIAQNGYNDLSIVFFPLLVLLIKLAAPVFNFDYGVAGFVVCNAFAFASFNLLYALFQLDFSDAVAARALLAFAVLPTSIYLNSIYTEPVFLTFALASVYAARSGKWWSAGLFGALAALTRNIGVFLAGCILWEFWEQNKKQALGLRTLHVAGPCALPVLALLGFMLYNYFLLGDPLAFVNTQKAWGRVFSPPWLNIVHGFQHLVQYADIAGTLDFLMTVAGIAGLAALTFLPGYEVPRSYTVIGWLWLLIPLTSTSQWLPLYSMSRFVLVVFPLYLCIARVRTGFFRVFIFICAGGLALCSMLFTNWHWLS